MMQFTISGEHEAWLAAQIASGSFASADEAICELIEAQMSADEEDDMMWAKPLVDEANAAIERGEVISLAEHEKEVEAHMEKLRRQYR